MRDMYEPSVVQKLRNGRGITQLWHPSALYTIRTPLTPTPLNGRLSENERT